MAISGSVLDVVVQEILDWTYFVAEISLYEHNSNHPRGDNEQLRSIVYKHIIHHLLYFGAMRNPEILPRPSLIRNYGNQLEPTSICGCLYCLSHPLQGQKGVDYDIMGPFSDSFSYHAYGTVQSFHSSAEV